MINIDISGREGAVRMRRQVCASGSQSVYLLLLAGRQLGDNGLFFVMTAMLK